MEPQAISGPLAPISQQFQTTSFTILAAVLALPALGALVNGLFGKRLGKDAVRLMALTAIGGSFLMSLVTMLLLPHDGALSWTAWHWFSVTGRMGQTIPIDVSFRVDGMTAVMMLVVTGVGFLIHLYSSEYMRKDPGYWRYFAYLNLFCFSMLILIMADNLALLFVGWEGVGMCSYLLIGFWFTDEKNASAGKKAFIVNRIGDFGLLVAMAALVYYCGSLKWDGINANAHNLLTEVKVWPIGNLSHERLPGFIGNLILPEHPKMVYASTLVGLALFLGCAGKSAQVPLYVWLPDAMAGPTPVSALIHAATMVTAGVYLVARMASVFVLSPFAMATIAVAGLVTAIFAASIGLFQNDLKKVLAYSTVSQLGFMFIGVGVGAFSAGFFHVFTHAFFKGCLFLGAGSVIHSMHARIHDTGQSQDMRNMGGLRKYLPITRWTFLASCFAIAGAPPFSGFWSKDEILWRAFSDRIATPDVGKLNPMWEWPPWLGPAIYWVGVLAATMTAFYMFRAYFMTFHGEFRGWKIVRGYKAKAHGHDDDHGDHAQPKGKLEGPVPHESPWQMTLPLVVLGFFAVFAGFFDAEPIHVEPLEHLLEPVFKTASHAVGAREGLKNLIIEGKGYSFNLMMLPGIGAFLAGTAGAVAVYWNRRGAPELAFQKAFPRLYELIYDKWRIDELYDATVVGMVDALADIFTAFDTWVVDGLLAKVSSALVAALGTILRALQTGRVQAYSAAMVFGIAGVGWFFLQPHASVTVDSAEVMRTGEIALSAAPGLGYSYRWEVPGAASADAFSQSRDMKVKLVPGEHKDVVLHVRSAFQGETSEVIPLARPGLGGASTATPTPMPMKLPVRPGGAQ